MSAYQKSKELPRYELTEQGKAFVAAQDVRIELTPLGEQMLRAALQRKSQTKTRRKKVLQRDSQR